MTIAEKVQVEASLQAMLTAFSAPSISPSITRWLASSGSYAISKEQSPPSFNPPINVRQVLSISVLSIVATLTLAGVIDIKLPIN